MTPTERFVWQQLRNHKACYYFRRQHRLEGYILDFYCHQARLCIEIDGLSHEIYHSERDRERDAYLDSIGIRTLRFRNEEVALDWEACFKKILYICMDRTSDSDPEAEDE